LDAFLEKLAALLDQVDPAVELDSPELRPLEHPERRASLPLDR